MSLTRRWRPERQSQRSISLRLGAYFPLYSLANTERLLEKSWPRAVKDLIVQQIEEPAEERRIRATLPALTSIEGEVSRAVREQYEENPYPRWIKGGPPIQPAILNRRPQPVLDVLIAGCGTGIFTTEFARKAPGARFLAIDLSLASLSYAKRMAQGFGLTNVEFAQADITKLGTLGRTFDFIDSSGVLHHIADPWAAWQVLVSLLRPGGIMQIGLYSEMGRRNVVAARALIAERGYRPVPEDIRRIREVVAGAEDGSLAEIDQPMERLFHRQRMPRPLVPSAGAPDFVAGDQIVPCGERPAIRGLHPRCIDVGCLRQALSGESTTSRTKRVSTLSPISTAGTCSKPNGRRHSPACIGSGCTNPARALKKHDPEKWNPVFGLDHAPIVRRARPDW